jgi:hypothetical protein
MATRAARFADAVAARHHGDPGAWLRCSTRSAPPARVLLRRRRVVPAVGHGSITFAPRIELRLAAIGARGGDVAGTAGRPVVRVLTRPATVSAPSLVPVLRRAGTRGVRDDGRGSSPTGRVRGEPATRSVAGAGAVPAGARSTPPARVLRRRAPLVTPTPAPVRDEPSTRATVQPPRPIPLSPLEINRLTDHIVHTIDRRIAAFRERQGRV